MFVVEWLFDKMGYTKKIEWTSSNLTWEDIEKTCPKFVKKPIKRKPAAKKSVQKRVRAKKA